MIKTMLILVDDIERAQKAISHAACIATSNTQVHLVGIIDAPEKPFIDAGAWNIATDEVKVLLNELGSYLEVKGIETTWAILKNPALELLISYIKHSQSDLLILGADSDGNAPLMADLLKLSPVPILIARDQPELPAYRKILAPLDESQRAECVLPLISDLLQSTQAKLVLTHVVHKPEMPRRTFMSSEDSALIQRLVESSQIEAENYLSQLAQQQAGETETHLLVDESVPTALHNLIQRENIDLVVLSAHGYSGEPRVSLGTITHNLINLCAVSMIVIQDMPATIASGNMLVLSR